MRAPKRSTANGISATEGMGRKNSIVDLVNRSRKLLIPIAIPKTVPATQAINSPMSHEVIVCRTASQNTGFPNSMTSCCKTFDIGGKNSLSKMLARETNSQMSAKPTTPIRPKLSFEYLRRFNGSDLPKFGVHNRVETAV